MKVITIYLLFRSIFYKLEGEFVIPKEIRPKGDLIGDYYHEYIKSNKDKKAKKKGKKLTTESSSSLSDTTTQKRTKEKKTEDTWDNGGIKVIDAQERELNPDVPNFGRQPFSDDEIIETFKVFDLNGNGYIGVAEVKFVLDYMKEDVTDEEVDEMIRMLDLDGDGQVSFKEFYKMATGQSLAPVGVSLPPAFEKGEIPEDNNLDFITKIKEKNMKKKKQSTSGPTSSIESSSSSNNSIKKEKKAALKMFEQR